MYIIYLCLVGLLQTMTIAWLLFHMRNQIARKCTQLLSGWILGYLIDPISAVLIAKLRTLLNRDLAEVRQTLQETLEEVRAELREVRTELKGVRTELAQAHYYILNGVPMVD